MVLSILGYGKINVPIIVPADVLGPNNVKPSAGTVLIKKLDMFSSKCFCSLSFKNKFLIADIIHTAKQDVNKSYGTFSVKHSSNHHHNLG